MVLDYFDENVIYEKAVTKSNLSCFTIDIQLSP